MNCRTQYDKDARLRLLALAALLAVIGLLQLLGNEALSALEYRRGELLERQQWWRLLTAHVVHLNLAHALMNGAALVLIMLLVGDALRVRHWFTAYALLAVLVSAGLLLMQPALVTYAGASGVIHGLLMLGAMLRWQRHKIESCVLIAGLVVKLGYEHRYGASPASAALIGAPVITLSHLLGAAGGAVVAALVVVHRRVRVQR